MRIVPLDNADAACYNLSMQRFRGQGQTLASTDRLATYSKTASARILAGRGIPRESCAVGGWRRSPTVTLENLSGAAQPIFCSDLGRQSVGARALPERTTRAPRST